MRGGPAASPSAAAVTAVTAGGRAAPGSRHARGKPGGCRAGAGPQTLRRGGGKHGRVAARGAARRAGVGGRAVAAAGAHQGPLVRQHGERGRAAGGALRGAPAERRGHAAGHRPQVRRHGKARVTAALPRRGAEGEEGARRRSGAGCALGVPAAPHAPRAAMPPHEGMRFPAGGICARTALIGTALSSDGRELRLRLSSESTLRWYQRVGRDQIFPRHSFRAKCSSCSSDCQHSRLRSAALFASPRKESALLWNALKASPSLYRQPLTRQVTPYLTDLPLHPRPSRLSAFQWYQHAQLHGVQQLVSTARAHSECHFHTSCREHLLVGVSPEEELCSPKLVG